ncbi:hypothetical protein DITRI_Ditri03aG0018900 [Diplodiscus trichospermus]
MEFKFRAVDGRTPNRFSSASSGLNSLSGQGFRPNPNFVRPEPVQWELEKARIREEIIASEIARRRALEAEVRRELLVEWEIAARHRAWETGLSFEHRRAMQLDPRLPFMYHFNNNHCQWRPEERFNFLPPPPLSPAPPPPMLPPQLTEVLGTEVKATAEGNKNKLIILAKPDPNRILGAKRKTPPPADIGKLPLPLIRLKKKPNEEWSCAICQVSTTSEKGLTEHIQGKKHKAKEARLKAQIAEKNSNTRTLPKKSRLIKEMPVTIGLGSETETQEKLTELSQNVDNSDQKLEDAENLKNKKDELLIKKEKVKSSGKKLDNDLKKQGATAVEKVDDSDQKLEDGQNLKNKKDVLLIKKDKAKRSGKKLDNVLKKQGSTAVKKVQKIPKLEEKKKYRLWCQICSVGAHSELVMEAHTKGRRHIARLRKLNKDNAAAPATTITTTNVVSEQVLKDNAAACATTTTNRVSEEVLDKDNAAVSAITTTDTVSEQVLNKDNAAALATNNTTNTVSELVLDKDNAVAPATATTNTGSD